MQHQHQRYCLINVKYLMLGKAMNITLELPYKLQ
jgi:hypothetical protein